MTWSTEVPNKTWEIIQGDALFVLSVLPSESVQCVVTSPPYYGLRDYGVEGQLGLETRPDCAGWATGDECGECYVCRLVSIFREVRRVLRSDGVAWLNLGDSYAQDSKWGGASGGKNYTSASGNLPRAKRSTGLKDKDLMMIPARVALALQADGWYLRSDVVWHKRAPMPESVQDRPTRAHEFVYLLTKSARYYYDAVAVREGLSPSSIARINQPNFDNQTGGDKDYGKTEVNTSRSMRRTLENFAKKNKGGGGFSRAYAGAQPNHGAMSLDRPDVEGRNMRDVWTLTPASYREAHFATFPTELPEKCIKAGTSERGCCVECGKPWARIIERLPSDDPAGYNGSKFTSGKSAAAKLTDVGQGPRYESVPIGWQAGCKCDAGEPVPCVVLDPFNGAGTAGLVARQLDRKYIGIELNPDYVALTERRIAGAIGVQAHEIADLEVAQSVQLRMIS